MQLYRSIDHVETRSPPYVCSLHSVAGCCEFARSPRTSWRSWSPSPSKPSRGSTRRVGGLRRLAQAGRATWSGCSPSATTRRSAPATRSSAGTRRRTARSEPRSSRPTNAAPESGSRSLDALEGWAAEHGCTELDGPVSEDDEGSLAWAARHGYHEIGRNSRLVLDLTTTEIAGPGAAGGDRDRDVGGPARARAGTVGGRPRGDAATSRARRRTTSARSRSGSRATCAARATTRAPSSSRSSTARSSATPSSRSRRSSTRARLPRPHRRQARPPRPRDRGRAQADADRLGEGERLHVAPDLERGPERADPPPERAARLRARAGSRDRPRRSRRYLAIASSIARLPITRARCERNSALAAVSVGGSVPSAMYAAGSASPATSACSTAAARSGVGAHVRQRDPGVLDRPSRCPAARAPRRRPSPSPARAG